MSRLAGSVLALVLALAPLARAQDEPRVTEGEAMVAREALEDPIDSGVSSAIDVVDRARSAAVAPNAPAVSIGWLGALRAAVGLPILIYADRPGWIVRLAPLIELYDRETFGGFPYQYWRGAIGLEVGLREPVAIEQGRLVLSVLLSLDHESDHETVNTIGAAGPVGRYSTFLYTNTISVHGGAAIVLSELSLAAWLSATVHALSCTRTDVACDLDAGRGGQSGGLALDVVARTGASDDRDRVQLCGAVHAAWSAAAGRMVEEARVRIHAGPCVRFARAGEWSLLAQLSLGSSTGMQRGTDELAAGGALRWAP